MGTIEGEEFFGEAICFTGVFFNSSYVTGEIITIDQCVLSCWDDLHKNGMNKSLLAILKQSN